MTPQVLRREQLSAAEVADVTALVTRAVQVDEVAPLSEHVLLHLARGGDTAARNIVVVDGAQVVGYAHLDVTDPVNGPSAELVVDPAARRRGIGRQLLEELLRQVATTAPVTATPASAPAALRLWAHGQHPGALALAGEFGFHRTRALWQMRRSLYAPLPAPRYPPGVTVRTFRTGVDEAAWVAINRRAFVDLPDQGQWTEADLQRREREPWFDPAGFFLAERDEWLLGFHWTKVHGGAEQHAHDRLGEVYVVGVDPAAQGGGLGTALTLTGLAYLRSLGLGSAMLYVDEDNTAAITVYQRLGFTRWDTDVTFAQVPKTPDAPSQPSPSR